MQSTKKGDTPMKRVLLIAVLITAASSLALGQTEVTKPDQSKPMVEKVVTKPDQSKPMGEKVATTSRAEQAVRQVFEELVSSYAKNDAAVPARIFADDFTFTNPIGEVMTKEQRIGQIKPGGVMFDSYSVDDVNVRIYGDTAVVTNRATLAGKRGDQALAGQYRVTQVFVKKGGNWQLVAAQSTPIVEQPKQ
jgi:uncharacterized protein (TIGR02246 family)